MPTTDAAPLHEPVLRWYAAHARDLPWRHPGCTPWGVLVSEVMAQQTPVARIVPPWEAWMTRWPTPASLAADTPAAAIRMWDRLGYPRRAVNLHRTALVLVRHHGGEVPSDEPSLRSLPGVGAYTAAAVAAFAFGRRTTVVDTNVRRVLVRALLGAAQAAPSLNAAERALALASTPLDGPTSVAWNVALMEVGALVCTARTPRCGQCPITEECAWFGAGRPAYDGPPRRGQRYEGTDRQVRGGILEALRQSREPLPRKAFDGLDEDPGRLDRCLAGLVEDGLVEPRGRIGYALPG